MVKEIIKDEKFLQIPSVDATEEDKEIGQDILDTLKAIKDECVGMAANMIGISKKIIAFYDFEEKKYVLMYNPHIVKCQNPYYAEEGCVSLEGNRKTKRFRIIKVEYLNKDFQKRLKTYKDYTAEIIQHQIDHCDGILI